MWQTRRFSELPIGAVLNYFCERENRRVLAVKIGADTIQIHEGHGEMDRVFMIDPVRLVDAEVVQ